MQQHRTTDQQAALRAIREQRQRTETMIDQTIGRQFRTILDMRAEIALLQAEVRRLRAAAETPAEEVSA